MHRLAVATAVVTFLLLVVGGIVTSRDAGMVFPDWPLSKGSINPEGWLRDADMLSEHGHRILGALVGLMTVILAVSLQRREGRRHVRVLGWTAVVAVCVQGLLGGLRVTEISGALALLHGCAGQAYFGLMVALAYVTSRDGTRRPERGSDVRGMMFCSVATLFAIFLQVILGAQLRHNLGPINTHLLGALLVSACVFWLLTVAMMRHPERTALRRPAMLLAGLLLGQVAVGLLTARTLNAEQVYSMAQVLLPTVHQALGALMFACSLVVVLRTFRRFVPLGKVVAA